MDREPLDSHRETLGDKGPRRKTAPNSADATVCVEKNVWVTELLEAKNYVCGKYGLLVFCFCLCRTPRALQETLGQNYVVGG